MKIFVFGLGQSALTLVRGHRKRFAAVAGTVRGAEKAEALRGEGIAAYRFAEDGTDDGIAEAFAGSDAVLVSIPSGLAGDPALARFGDAIARAPKIRWIGYLSTIGVYGDHGGAWIDETIPVDPQDERARRRIAAEGGWLDLGARSGKPAHVFRLGGIYGPGANPLRNLRAGTARRIVKPGQVFNRVHMEDIASAVLASLAQPRAGAIYNVVDDEPAPPQDVVAYAAGLLGLPPPPEEPFDPERMSPMAVSFYGRNKRVSNARLKRDLGWRPIYPTYREGLAALLAAGEGAQAA